MNRRRFLAGAALTAATANINRLGANRISARAQVRAPSVLLIIADDQGLDLGCYGASAISTPQIDRLAGEGIRFTHGFAAVSSCSSSRSVMQTGLFTHTSGQYGLAHGFHNQKTLASIESLPKLLGAAGYYTGIVGKKHVEPEAVYPFEFHIEGARIAGNRDVAAMAEAAGEFFAKSGNRPFFLTVGYSDPHRAQAGFGNAREYARVRAVNYDPARVRVPYHLPDLPEVRRDLADYCTSVSRLDAGVGMLVDELKRSGRDRDTLIIYVSDNGIPFTGAKTNLYDAGIHLPLIIVAPGLAKRGATNSALASWIDLAPTILEWTGVKGPARYELPGRSLLPILTQDDVRGWDEVCASHTFHEITMYYPMRAVRTPRYKYIVNLAHQLPYPQASDILNSPTWRAIVERRLEKSGERLLEAYFERPAEELYDLERDANELRNVAGAQEHAPALAEMRARMKSFRERTKDPWLAAANAGH